VVLHGVNVQCLRIIYIMQSCTTVIHPYLKTSVLCLLEFFFRLYFFLPPVPYFIPSFLNVTVLHCSIFTKAAYSQTSNWLLVRQCTTSISAALYFHTKRLKTSTRNFNSSVGLHNINSKSLNIHSVYRALSGTVANISSKEATCYCNEVAKQTVT
jgi:hypothetical protein